MPDAVHNTKAAASDAAAAAGLHLQSMPHIAAHGLLGCASSAFLTEQTCSVCQTILAGLARGIYNNSLCK